MLVDFRLIVFTCAFGCARPNLREERVEAAQPTPAASLAPADSTDALGANSALPGAWFAGSWVVDLAWPPGAPAQRVVMHLQGARAHIQLNRELGVRVLRFQALLIDGVAAQVVLLSARDSKAYVLDFEEYGAEVAGWVSSLQPHVRTPRARSEQPTAVCATESAIAFTSQQNIQGCASGFSAPWSSSPVMRSSIAAWRLGEFANQLPLAVWASSQPIWEVREQRPHPVADRMFAIPAGYATVSLGQLLTRLQSMGVPMNGAP